MGTLLSMLVFFALFGVFLTQYLPLWMAQNESQFTYQAQSSMETLKQYVDDQAIFGGPRTYAVPFTMSSQGVALFAQPTQGSLAFAPGGCTQGFVSIGVPVNPGACSFQTISLTAGPSSSQAQIQPILLQSTSNLVQMQLPNRYYPSQTLYYENDAVISLQSGGQQRMLVPPPFNLTYSPTNTTLTLSYVVLTGSAASYQTQGTKDVYTALVSNASYSSFDRFVDPSKSPSLLTFNATFAIGTRNVCAWYSFLSLVLSQSKIPKESGSAPFANTGYVLSPASAPSAAACVNPAGTTTDITLNLYNINFAQIYSGITQISITTGGL